MGHLALLSTLTRTSCCVKNGGQENSTKGLGWLGTTTPFSFISSLCRTQGLSISSSRWIGSIVLNFHPVVHSTNSSREGCVSLAFKLPPVTRASFTQPLRNKYALLCLVQVFGMKFNYQSTSMRKYPAQDNNSHTLNPEKIACSASPSLLVLGQFPFLMAIPLICCFHEVPSYYKRLITEREIFCLA